MECYVCNKKCCGMNIFLFDICDICERKIDLFNLNTENSSESDAQHNIIQNIAMLEYHIFDIRKKRFDHRGIIKAIRENRSLLMVHKDGYKQILLNNINISANL